MKERKKEVVLWLDCACMMGSSETGWHASTKYVIHCINISYNLFSFPFSLLFVFFFIQEIHLMIFYFLSPWILFLQIGVLAKTSLLIWDTPQKYFSLGRCFLIPVISDQTKWTLILTKTFFWASRSAWGCCCGWQALRARRSAAGHCGGASVPS